MATKPQRDTVLLLTHSGDYYTVERVADALARRGAKTFRFDTDRFPREVRLGARLGADGFSHTVEDGAAECRAEAVRAVWARKIWPPELDEKLDPKFQRMCVRESVAALDGFLDGLHGARWINERGRDSQAENKLLQLRLAQEGGLRIPRTLLTNDAGQAREFFQQNEGALVAKLLAPVSFGMGADSAFVYTNEVGETDLEDMSGLRHSPMVFQERIPKSLELRIAYVAGKFFSGALDASRSAGGQVDWRRATPEECQWQRASIPPELEAQLSTLMNRLRLVYGAIDIIRTPAGEHVFLEVNPGGEWGMLERDLDLPISEAIADALLA
ncbi:MAG TPA: MvdC family ATP-grasp ribosomal peptide maturase [Pyrinomonadaceae bacterium]|jgi:MvdC family ATP-grasp ribosomal peptide maturase|nr:MvdC family ATP-grasp ribosomal peptide maturase [Pyrinomonadaceae bacterium]